MSSQTPLRSVPRFVGFEHINPNERLALVLLENKIPPVSAFTVDTDCKTITAVRVFTGYEIGPAIESSRFVTA
jgi:hypothetical protein